jgi:uncharacterized protein YjbJ (UPF0337 family)
LSIPKPDARIFSHVTLENLLGVTNLSTEKQRLALWPFDCNYILRKELSSNMNSDQFEGKWKQLKGSVKQRWGKLTDDDLTSLSGKKDELVGKLQERYGITREQAEREANEWAAYDETATGTHPGRL